jgi:hypothetical protein
MHVALSGQLPAVLCFFFNRARQHSSWLLRGNEPLEPLPV